MRTKASPPAPEFKEVPKFVCSATPPEPQPNPPAPDVLTEAAVTFEETAPLAAKIPPTPVPAGAPLEPVSNIPPVPPLCEPFAPTDVTPPLAPPPVPAP